MHLNHINPNLPPTPNTTHTHTHRFSLLWKILRQILNEATQKKVRVAASGNETLNAFKEFIDVENIPVVRVCAWLARVARGRTVGSLHTPAHHLY